MTVTADREDWKTKYRDLLSEMERKEGDWEARDGALRGVASRLAITAMGRDARVDEHLSAILEAIKGGEPEAQIAGELDGLSAAVLRQESQPAEPVAVDLSGFVASLAIEPASQKRCIDALEADGAGHQHEALEELARELNALLQAPSAAEAPPTDAATTTLPEVVEAFVRHVHDVPGLADAVTKLRQRLTAGLAAQEQAALLDRLGAAVRQVIRAMDEDREELEAFLEQVTQQLTRFEDWATGHETDSAARRDDADSLERRVEAQVGGLESDVEASTDTADLKERVQLRLDTIAEQLRVFRRNEARRVEEAGRRNAALRDEVDRLRVRTAELAERCSAQEDRLMHDLLTGVHTRYAYDQRLQEEFQRWQRHGQPLSFAIWDIDFFKRVNDSYGHQAGDRLLAAVARLLSDSTRVEDFVARLGGEEFVVLFPATDLAAARPLVERLREKIAAAKFHFRGSPLPVTVSCGLTEFRAGDTPTAVYERADKALYEAKSAGRNRCAEA